MMKHQLLFALPLFLGQPSLATQDSAPAPKAEGASAEIAAAEQAEQIAWFGRWKDAVAESTRTGRPILLMSAAPQCSGTPGMW